MYNTWGVGVVEARERLTIGGQARTDLDVMELPRPTFEALLTRPDMKDIAARRV